MVVLGISDGMKRAFSLFLQSGPSTQLHIEELRVHWSAIVLVYLKMGFDTVNDEILIKEFSHYGN